MTLDQLKTYIEFTLDSHSSGNKISPKEFNILLEAHISPFVKSQVLAYRQYVNQGTPMDDVVSTALMIESLQKLATPVNSSGIFTLPGDYLMINSVWGTYNSNYKRIEIVSSEEYAKRIHNHLSKPIAYFPVGYIIATVCRFFPTNMTAITCEYIGKPITPVYDYYVDANYNTVYMAAGSTHVLAAGEYGSAGQTSGTVTSLTTETNLPEDLHLKFADYLVSKLAIKDRDVNLYQASLNEQNK